MRINKKAAAAAVAAVTLAGSGVAFAYWTSSGTGSGSASTGTDTAWHVTSTPVTSATLTPGGPAEAVTYTVRNDSTGHQYLAKVNVQIAATAAGPSPSPWTASAVGAKPDCTKADFELSETGADGTWAAPGAAINATLQAGDVGPTPAFVTGTFYIHMINRSDTTPGTGNQDNCKSLPAVPLYLFAS